MCGIIGILSRERNVVPMLIEGLKSLTYRGYDSCGIAIIENGKLRVYKDVGTIERLVEEYNLKEKESYIGIGHSRWATHGIPTRENAQPQIDCEGKIAVSENGIISNAYELDEELEKRGHRIRSNCDSEPAAHIIEEEMKEGKDLLSAVFSMIKKLEGLYAMVIISEKEPDKIIGVRNGNPLMLGVGKDTYILASDLPTIARFTRKYIPIKDGEIVVITRRGFKIMDSEGKEIKRKILEIGFDIKEVSKGEFETFMKKEIYEQPTVIQNPILLLNSRRLEEFAREILKARRVFLIGCGSSYNASVVGSYWLNKISRILAIPVIASEFKEIYGNVIGKDDVVVAVSQSGETQHVIQAVKFARERGAKVLGIVNVEGSQLTFLSDKYINIGAGPEISVLATKTFTNQLMTFFVISLKAGILNGTVSDKEFEEISKEVEKIPKLIRESIEISEEIVPRLAKKYKHMKGIFVLSHGLNFGTALEGSLKIKEVSYIYSEVLPSGELLHGHLALIDPSFLSIFLVNHDNTFDFILGNITEVWTRKGKIIAVSSKDLREVRKVSDHHVLLPETNPLLTPFVFTPFLQLFAYYLGKELGRNIDMPRNLAKTITVT